MLERLQFQDTLQQRVVLVNLSILCLERLMKPITLIRVLGSALKRCNIIFIFYCVIFLTGYEFAMRVSVELAGVSKIVEDVGSHILQTFIITTKL